MDPESTEGSVFSALWKAANTEMLAIFMRCAQAGSPARKRYVVEKTPAEMSIRLESKLYELLLSPKPENLHFVLKAYVCFRYVTIPEKT